MKQAYLRLNLSLTLQRFCLLACLILISGHSFGLQELSRFQQSYRYAASGILLAEISPTKNADLSNFEAKRYLYELPERPSLVTAIEVGVLQSWQDESVSPSDWNGFTVDYVERYVYDDYGRKEFVGRTKSTGDYVKLKQFSYDESGRLECEAVRMSGTSLSPSLIFQSACDLTADEVQFGPDRITKYTYDYQDNLLVVTKALKTSYEQDYATYTYEDGRKATVKDANGNLTKLTYDGLARLSRVYYPHKDVANRGQYNQADYEEYNYDKNGNRTYLRKRSGKQFSFDYDALNRKRYQNDLASSGGDILYQYNLLGLVRQVNFGNAETGALGDSRRIIYRYNGFGEKNVEYSEFGVVQENNYIYDEHGNVSLKWSGSQIVSFQLAYIYNDRDQLTSIKEYSPFGSSYVDFEYQDLGPLSKMNAGLVEVNYGYEAAALNEISNNFSGNTYDLTQNFKYSPAMQVHERTLSNDLFHHTDGVGVVGKYTTNGLNQYTFVNNSTLAYDNDGNLSLYGNASEVNTYLYDNENRLIEVNGDTKTSLYYDPLGRLYLVTGSEWTYFTYDGDNVISEYQSPTAQHAYIYAGSAGAPLFDFAFDGNVWRGLFLATNHQGSVIAGADFYGRVESGFVNSYDVYGVPGDANMGRFGYTGQMWLPEIDLYHYRARMYNPGIGRFLQTDPVGYKDQMNLYAYVGNDPMNNTDPTGKYGRGTGFTDKEWKKFDKAQKSAAKKMNSRAAKLEKKADKLDKKGKEGGDNLRTAASNLKKGVNALNSDGSDGKVANAVSGESWTRNENVAGYVNGVGGNTMTINLGHDAFKAGGTAFKRVLTHESLHTAGLSDRNIWGVKSYCCSGVQTYLDNYNSLTPDQQVLNPDFLTEMTW